MKLDRRAAAPRPQAVYGEQAVLLPSPVGSRTRELVLVQNGKALLRLDLVNMQ